MLFMFSSFAHRECFADEKEKYYILLFVSNSILKSNMMRGMMSFQLSDYHIDKIKFIKSSNLSLL